MPTAAKLVAAIILAITGYFASQTVQLYIPEEQRLKWLVIVAVLVPVPCAWRTVGRMVGKSYWASFNAGFYGMFVSTFYILLAYAIGEMLKRSIRLRYDGPMEAITSMFGIAVEYGAYLLNPPMLIILASGAAVAGIGAEWAHRKWG